MRRPAARPHRALPAALIALATLSAPGTARADWLASLEGPVRSALEGDRPLVALGLVFLAGLATSLTPCVYPMVAITVSVFGAREAPSRLHGAALSTAYVLGIAALFTPLGITAALTGGVFGAFLASPWVAAALAVVFAMLALSMLGAFDLALPASAQTRLAQIGGAGPRGAFALGFVSGLIAAPCTGPVLAFLLTWIGTSGKVGFGGAALFVYALGVGALFWVVGTFAVTLPKSGRWLEGVKSAFGVVMLVVALYYVRDWLPVERPAERAWPWLASGFALVAAGLLLGAVHRSFHDPSAAVRARKALGVAAIALGGTALVWFAEAVPPGAKIPWGSSYAEARALAEREARPLLVDFGASWCGACGELDRNTFSDPRVVAAALRLDVVPVRVDLSPGEDTPENRAALASYDQRGLPLVVLHRVGGAEAARITTFVGPDEFLEFLRLAN